MRNFIIVLHNHPKSEHFAKIAISTAAINDWELEVFDAIDGRYNGHRLFQLEKLKASPITKIKKAFSKPGVVGCFLSHYTLWKKCLSIGEPIAIFEEDVIFQKPPKKEFQFKDILKLEETLEGKDYSTGRWWAGAYAYMITPTGAEKLLKKCETHHVFPADVMLGTNIVDVEFDSDGLVILNADSNIALSTTYHSSF
jgi:GR25 family glycosyltransferase involved in LPS biosynthesis